MTTPVEHAEAFLAAVTTLKHLEETGATPTPEQRATLAAYPGAGPVALTLFPDPQTGAYKSDTWKARGEQVQALCTPEEYDSLLRSTFSAFYTSPLVMDTAFAVLKQCGVPDTARVLEPGCGTGQFLSRAPEGMRFVAVELDRISAKIALLLWPDQDIRQGDLTTCGLPEGRDAAVGNVPFADTHYTYQGVRFSLHEVVLARTLDSLKPGGIAVLVITHSFLDRQQPRFREVIAGKADLLGAVRLPSDAFADQGTAVVADVVVFQKHDGGPTGERPAWCDSGTLALDGLDLPVSTYFLTNPRMVLGTFSREDRLYGAATSYSVTAPADLPGALTAALACLPTGVFPVTEPVVVDEAEEDIGTVRALPDGAAQLPEGALYIDTDGIICQRAGRGGVEVVYQKKTLSAASGKVGACVAALIRMREQVREVLHRQQYGAGPSEKQAARSLLTMQHRLFVARYGPINKTTLTATKDGKLQRRTPNLARFRDDPESMLVCALEHYNEEEDTAARAAIFTQDVVGPQAETTQVATAEAALLASLDVTGGVDLALMSDLYGKPQAEIVTALGALIYLNPETERWDAADTYLSGNVRAKLQAAQRAGAGFARNIAALEAVQPEDLLPSEIDAQLGAPWIPPADVEAFLRETCEAREYWRCTITYIPQEAVWALDLDWRYESSLAMSTTYGTRRANGVQLLEQALNLRLPKVYDAVWHGDTKTLVLNLTETVAAREKQRELMEAFQTWLWQDAPRAERLVRVYNDLYNCLRLRAFDGSHLQFPGLAATWVFTPEQKHAIWRILSGGNTLLGHAVGGGKTSIMMAAGMKLRQAGRIRKPLYCVPNHMLEQFIRECLQLYPNARMLLASSDDMSKRKRKLLSARIATGDWDGIITTHSAFERMGMSVAYQARYLRGLIQQYSDLLTDGPISENASDKGHKNIRKRLEKQKARYEEKLEGLLATGKKDDSLVFDELGIDYLFVDELQQFKNLETPSKLENVAGIQTDGSQRAFDMALKLQYLREQHPGQSVTGASGTPISNTMVEMFTMQRYLDPTALADRGLHHFDAWARVFGSIEEVMEIAPDGRTMRARQRFAKFVNLTELQLMFRTFADVRTKEQLRLPVPQVDGGKAHVISCPMSEAQRRLQDALVARYEAIRKGQVKPWEDNALAITTDGRKLALDVRLLDRDAGHDPAGKLQACADQVLAIYHATRETLATQLVFCDMGVNPTAWGFSAYESLIDVLVKGGMPRAEVACIQDAATDADKHTLFEKVRQGKVAVLIGSTAKMGTGTNVQHRLLALHHLDAPWKPAEVEQREGRIIRQKNMHQTVYLYTYVTQGSFDAYMWQALQTKAGFIGQVMHGTLTTREVQDVDDQALTFAEVKAIATGNPAMLTLAKVEAECRRLKLLKQQHADGQYRAQQQWQWLPGEIEKLERRLTALRADLVTLADSDPAVWMLDGKPHTEPEAVEVLTAWAQTQRAVYATQDFPVGTYRGLQVFYRLHSMAQPQVVLRGQIEYTAPVDQRAAMGVPIVRAVKGLLHNYPGWEQGLVLEIERSQRTLANYGTALGQPFAQAAYKETLDGLAKELKASLREDAPEDGRSPEAIVQEIEQLRAAQHGGTSQAVASTRVLSIAESVQAQIRARQTTTGA